MMFQRTTSSFRQTMYCLRHFYIRSASQNQYAQSVQRLGHGLNQQGTAARFSGRTRDVSLLNRVQTGSFLVGKMAQE
jgi:hypothetical protein